MFYPDVQRQTPMRDEGACEDVADFCLNVEVQTAMKDKGACKDVADLISALKYTNL